MEPRHKYSVHILRHPEANCGNGEWWKVFSTDSIYDAKRYAQSLAWNANEKTRIYCGSTIIK